MDEFQHYITLVLQHWNDLNGRARRREYWCFRLAVFIGEIIFVSIDYTLGTGFLTLLFVVVTLIPSLTVLVRRLHDVGLSGWFVLARLLPVLGELLLLYFTVKDSQPGANRYGPNPKGVGSPAFGRV